MKTSSRKRKTAVKKVAKGAKKRAKPTLPRGPAKPAKPTKPVKTKPGKTRAGQGEPNPSRYFLMFAFDYRDEMEPVAWVAAWGGTPRIGPPHEEAEPREGEPNPGPPGPVEVNYPPLDSPREDDPRLSPKSPDPALFFLMSPYFSSPDEANRYALDPARGAYFFERCTNCVLYQVD